MTFFFLQNSFLIIIYFQEHRDRKDHRGPLVELEQQDQEETEGPLGHLAQQVPQVDIDQFSFASFKNVKKLKLQYP